jgi:hypothetical protein
LVAKRGTDLIIIEAPMESNCRELHVLGTCLGSVNHVSEIQKTPKLTSAYAQLYGSEAGGPAASLVQQLCEWIHFCFLCKASLTNEQANQFDLVAVLIEMLNDSLPPTGPVVKSEKLEEAINIFLDEADLLFNIDLNDADLTECVERHRDAFRAPELLDFWFCSLYLEDFTMFSSSDGRVGVTFGHVDVGDLVVLIAGADGPLILRRKNLDEYICVGSACVAGIMDGEAWPRM